MTLVMKHGHKSGSGPLLGCPAVSSGGESATPDHGAGKTRWRGASPSR